MGRSYAVLAIFCVLLAAAGVAVMAQSCTPPEGESRLTIGADAWIDTVCVDGVSYCWPHSKRKKDSAKCNVHTINIPYEAQVIGIKASNHHAFAGLFGCVKGTATGTYGWWMCQKASYVTDLSWCSAGYDDSDWQDPVTFKISTCQKMPANQCGQSKHSWFWLQDVKARDIVCRLQKCAKNCKVCDKAGPGKCDGPQYCYYGSSVDPATGQVVCKSACTVDMQSYGVTQPDSEKVCYARIKNAAGTDYIESFPKTYYAPRSFNAGEFVMTVDVSSCSLSGPYLITTCNRTIETTYALNTWSITPSYINTTALDLTLDKGDGGDCSFAPFMTVWIFDGTNITGNIQYLSAKYTNARFTLTGVTGYKPVYTLGHVKQWQP